MEGQAVCAFHGPELPRAPCPSDTPFRQMEPTFSGLVPWNTSLGHTPSSRIAPHASKKRADTSQATGVGSSATSLPRSCCRISSLTAFVNCPTKALYPEQSVCGVPPKPRDDPSPGPAKAQVPGPRPMTGPLALAAAGPCHKPRSECNPRRGM